MRRLSSISKITSSFIYCHVIYFMLLFIVVIVHGDHSMQRNGFFILEEDSTTENPTDLKCFHRCLEDKSCNNAVTSKTKACLTFNGDTDITYLDPNVDVWRKIIDIPTDLDRKVTVNTTSEAPTIDPAIYTDCMDAKNKGKISSGIYHIKPNGTDQFDVYCDMTIDQGGWMVFQRRKDGTENFYRNWTDYRHGFGVLDGEFWLGLEKLHKLAYNGKTLRIDLQRFDGVHGYAKYSDFVVQPEGQKYRLKLGRFSGNATDSLGYHNNTDFSTVDQDNDNAFNKNCAETCRGGWWFDDCHDANLNGIYGNIRDEKYMSWYLWASSYGNIKFSEMKLK